MKQFDVYRNPLAGARKTYPLIVIMQADVVGETGGHRVVAPLVPVSAFRPPSTRVLPIVSIDALQYVVMIPTMESFPVKDLKQPTGHVGCYREALLDAVDWLFFSA